MRRFEVFLQPGFYRLVTHLASVSGHTLTGASSAPITG